MDYYATLDSSGNYQDFYRAGGGNSTYYRLPSGKWVQSTYSLRGLYQLKEVQLVSEEDMNKHLMMRELSR